MISSILLLHWGLSANTHNSTLSSLGLDLKLHSMSYAKVQTAIYLKISLSDFLTVFAARTRKVSQRFHFYPSSLMHTVCIHGVYLLQGCVYICSRSSRAARATS